jgi:glycosyltransferase involved in cell wall biosynthesis
VTKAVVSAVIPVYNDREALEEAIPRSLEALQKITGNFELIVAEDGSIDGSAEIVRSFASRDSRVILLHSDDRLGRGRALTRAFQAAKSPVVCYYDVDLATDLSHLPALVAAIENGCDIATGSRLMPESRIERSGGREIASRGYNLLVRTLLSSRLRDHQCGFKAFNREHILALLPTVQDTHWFWDTEVLVRAQRAGYRVCEFPVNWRQGKKTTVRRNDVWKMGSSVLKLWWQVHVSKD